MRYLLSLLFLFLIAGCGNIESDQKVNSSKEMTKQREITEEEKKYIQLILNEDYEILLEQTEGKANEVQKDYNLLAAVFNIENDLEKKVEGIESELVVVSIYKQQYKDIKNNIEKVKYIPDELKQKVDELDKIAKEKYAFYSEKVDEEEFITKADNRTYNPRTVKIGMTQEEVLTEGWGRPNDINKTTTSYGVKEQWVYDNYNYLYFEDGILVTIQN
ncbi:hypothetical protein ABET51_06765 [Metabacillus fastidiosus]|uniref:hypothetical protein n=1 Tax=Metabacillus fastidiosus TaxID=1458 RepID=UPI003D289067